MRQRSKTNSRPGENLKLRVSYARAHVACELGWFLPDHFRPGASAETHHIMTGRYDLVSNLLRVSTPGHNWLEQFKSDGRIVALWVKHEKGELDPEEFHTACGIYLPGWLHRDREIRNGFVVPMLQKLRKAFP